MSAGKYNITIEQGADFALAFTLKEDDSAKDLSGLLCSCANESKEEFDGYSGYFCLCGY